jgi:hypothetical protein
MFRPQKRSLKVKVAVGVAATVAVVAAATPAYAMHRVDPFACSVDQSLFGKKEYTAFIEIRSPAPLITCFADAGEETFTPPYDADRFWSGNNFGVIRFKDAAGATETQAFKKNQSVFFDGKVQIEWLKID